MRALSGRRPGCRKSRFPSVPRAADRQSPFPASFLADLAREIASPIDPNASSLLALSGSSPARQRAQPGVSCAVCGARVLYSTLNLNYEVLQRSTTRARRAPDTILNASPSRARRAASQTEMHDLLARHRCQACATRADCESPSILPGLPRGRDAPAEIWLSSTPARLRAMPCGRCTSSAPEINCDA